MYSAKFYLLLFLSCYCGIYVYGQDSLARKEKLSDSVIARYYVRADNPNVKNGPYMVYYHRHTLIVAGHYTNGKKTGVWQFFDLKGQLNERFNYDKKAFTFEASLYSSADLSFLFDDSLKKGDKITRPLKVGGVYYGFIPYLNLFHVPFGTFNVDTDTFEGYVELLISPMGRLADYQVLLGSDVYAYRQTFHLDVKLFSEEDRTFIPATLNGEPVMSRILIHCSVTGSGGLDFY